MLRASYAPDGIAALAAAVRGGETTARAVALAALEAIEMLDPEVQAFTAMEPERVLADAERVDALVARGEGVPLAGVPIGVKDVIDVAGLPTSLGTPAVPPWIATGDAGAIRTLREAGALVVGKTRTSELAWRSDTPPTRNPRYPELGPGGSSGGSAAAVAAGLVPVALGTDTGGSVRWPASVCGCVGVKPTYGLVDLAGVVPCSPALDHVGLLAASVADARAVLTELARDESVARQLGAPGPLPAGPRLGLIDDPLFAIGYDVGRHAFDDALERAREAGATILTLTMPELQDVVTAMHAISLADARLFPKQVEQNASLLAEDVQEQLRAAALLPVSAAVEARLVKHRVRAQVAALFQDHGLDAIVLPGMVELPTRRDGDGAGTAPVRASAVNYLASLTGHPAVTIPSGDGPLPASLQLVGPRYGDAALLDLADWLETRAADPS